MILLGLSGCADFGHTIILSAPVEVSLKALPDTADLIEVTVYDARTKTEMERTALGTSMGVVEFSPPEVEIIRSIVTAQGNSVLAKAGRPGRAKIVCGIRKFDVKTPSTVAYWDMTVDIEILLRVEDRQLIARGSATERTWIWPTQERLQEVSDTAIETLSLDIAATLASLLLVDD